MKDVFKKVIEIVHYLKKIKDADMKTHVPFVRSNAGTRRLPVLLRNVKRLGQEE